MCTVFFVIYVSLYNYRHVLTLRKQTEQIYI